MKFLLYILVFISSTACFAQNKAWNNWYFGARLGMSFNNGTRTLNNNNPISANYGAACVSDPVGLGQFFFMTDGKRCYDRNFDAMPVALHAAQTQVIYSFIVPYPGVATKYYVFTVDNAHTLSYAIVDMALRGGMGNVTGPATQLKANADHHFTAVKRLYNDGYWLITHTHGSDEFEVFAITNDGIETNPVVSKTGKQTSAAATWVYGNMISDKTGEVIVHCASNFTQVFDFDKKCGTLSLKHDLTGGISTPSAAFSLSDKYLYVSWGKQMVQYDMTLPDPNTNINYLGGAAQRNNVRIALGPDGLIYCTSAENSAVTPKVSVVYDADDATASYKINDVNLNNTSQYKYVENWPPFIMDWTNPGEKPDFEMPEINVDAGCVDELLLFEVTGNFQHDSLEWDFGDGNTADKMKGDYQYTAAGEYEVSFNWYLCGFKYSLKEKITVGEEPEFTLGVDTALCPGVSLLLEGPQGADSYLWSNGDNVSTMLVDSAGTYWLQAGNGSCFFTDSINISYHPPVLVELGEGHFICEDDEQFTKLDAGKGFESYLWTPTRDTSQWIIVKQVGDYYVVVEDFRGCSGEDGATVERRCPVSFILPNAFSPNSDGNNDLFKPVFSDVVQYEMVIYNRWGERLFASDDPEIGWDGTYKKIPSPIGVYSYRIFYSGYGKNGVLLKYNRAGQVHLMR